MILHEKIKEVNSKRDFINFLNELIADNKENESQWENKSVAEYIRRN